MLKNLLKYDVVLRVRTEIPGSGPAGKPLQKGDMLLISTHSAPQVGNLVIIHDGKCGHLSQFDGQTTTPVIEVVKAIMMQP
jgi:hypothetical protein